MKYRPGIVRMAGPFEVTELENGSFNVRPNWRGDLPDDGLQGLRQAKLLETLDAWLNGRGVPLPQARPRPAGQESPTATEAQKRRREAAS